MEDSKAQLKQNKKKKRVITASIHSSNSKSSNSNQKKMSTLTAGRKIVRTRIACSIDNTMHNFVIDYLIKESVIANFHKTLMELKENSGSGSPLKEETEETPAIDEIDNSADESESLIAKMLVSKANKMIAKQLHEYLPFVIGKHERTSTGTSMAWRGIRRKLSGDNDEEDYI